MVKGWIFVKPQNEYGNMFVMGGDSINRADMTMTHPPSSPPTLAQSIDIDLTRHFTTTHHTVRIMISGGGVI